MPTPKYKQRCALCKKNMVLMYSARQFPKCKDCQMRQIEGEVTDKEYKDLLNIPKELYEQSSFLRSIKESFLRNGALTQKQIEAFKKVVGEMRKGKSQG